MALSAANRTTLANFRAAVQARIDAFQATFFAAHGRYRQFARSHVLAPQNAVAVLPDNLTSRPSNEQAGTTLADAARSAVAWPCSVEVHTYQAAGDRHGYVTIYRARGSGGEGWRFVENVGPEAWRAQAIHQEANGA